MYEELKWSLESKSTDKNVSLAYFFSTKGAGDFMWRT